MEGFDIPLSFEGLILQRSFVQIVGEISACACEWRILACSDSPQENDAAQVALA